MAGLTMSEVMKVVNRWIGVNGGYLGDFSYRTHAEFYAEYCNLDINPYELQGTTRERFIEILTSAGPAAQAKILRGVLERFPVGTANLPTRTAKLHDDILGIINRLENTSPVAPPTLANSSAVVALAIADAETLLASSGATSAVDRIHTALHGYLITACDTAGIAAPPEPSTTTLFRLLRENHPALQAQGPRAQDILTILRAAASILDALNPVRNKASVAHPNEELLEKDEAMLVINIAKSLLHFLNAKLR
ncbi:MAG: abortive infection family protein [Thermoanaerobaculales bacterium]